MSGKDRSEGHWFHCVCGPFCVEEPHRPVVEICNIGTDDGPPPVKPPLTPSGTPLMAHPVFGDVEVGPPHIHLDDSRVGASWSDRSTPSIDTLMVAAGITEVHCKDLYFDLEALDSDLEEPPPPPPPPPHGQMQVPMSGVVRAYPSRLQLPAAATPSSGSGAVAAVIAAAPTAPEFGRPLGGLTSILKKSTSSTLSPSGSASRAMALWNSESNDTKSPPRKVNFQDIPSVVPPRPRPPHRREVRKAAVGSPVGSGEQELDQHRPGDILWHLMPGDH
mmetsp:Transcript_119909/g.311147  ORF Transcript_119909/g.311147 Transcript_119909/m.311147 type:complete len:276 (+) Transcript_119909:232-1059(+)